MDEPKLLLEYATPGREHSRRMALCEDAETLVITFPPRDPHVRGSRRRSLGWLVVPIAGIVGLVTVAFIENAGGVAAAAAVMLFLAIIIAAGRAYLRIAHEGDQATTFEVRDGVLRIFHGTGPTGRPGYEIPAAWVARVRVRMFWTTPAPWGELRIKPAKGSTLIFCGGESVSDLTATADALRRRLGVRMPATMF